MNARAKSAANGKDARIDRGRKSRCQGEEEITINARIPLEEW